MSLKIVGAGFGRTGTHSLKIALETLGFGPCYHMYELVKNESHIERWKQAANGGLADWEAVFGNYHSAVGWPTCTYWRELLSEYADAKIILTVRDPEEWYDAAISTIFKAIGIGRQLKDQKRRSRCEVSGKIILDRTFSGRHEDKHFVIDKYLDHIEEVRSATSKRQLLEFDVSEGWEPLCKFLNVQVPQIDFPETNTRKEFLQALLNGGI